MNPLSVLLSFPYGIAVIDRQLKVLFANPALYELFKIPPQGDKESANLLFSDNYVIINQLELFFRDGKGFLDHDYTIKTADGDSSVELAIYHIDFGGRDTGACLTVRSNKGRQELHSEQEKSEKISMLAMMSTGLAHEIKNPLGGIKGAAQLLSREHGDKENYCQMIVSETERINSLVDELLSLGKQKQQKPVKLNIHKVLDETALLQKSMLEKKDIKLIRDYDPSLPLLNGRPDRLKQLFINLIKNAVETMENGGELRLRTRTVLDPAPKPLKGKKKLMMSVDVIDSGSGIDPKVEKQLFTPFITGKTEGTGLGLVLSLKIAGDHGGTLTLQNNINKEGATGASGASGATGATGATARVILPLAP